MPTGSPTRVTHLIAALLLGAASALLPSCASSRPKSTIEAEQPIGPAGLTPSQIQEKVRIFGDSFASLIAQGSDELLLQVDTPELRSTVTHLKLAMAHAGYSIAASQSSLVAVIDMTVMVTLQLDAMERYWNPEVFDGKADRLAAALRAAKEQVWELAALVFSPQDLGVLQVLIDRWRRDHPTQWYVTHIRFGDFTEYRGMQMTTGKEGGLNLFRLFMLDPLAGLDPTLRQIEQTRQLAERLFYFLSRTQILVNWQVQALAYDLTALPESQSMLVELQTYGAVAQQLADTADRLPGEFQEIITAERQAAIEQVHRVITVEREGLVRDLETQAPVVQDVLAELRQTLDAGATLSASINETLDKVQAMSPPPTAEAPGRPAEPPPPFAIRDYEAAAAQATEAARELNQLVLSMDGLIGSPALDARLDELDLAVTRLETSGKRLLNHAFLLAAGLVAVIFVGALIKTAVKRPR